MTKPLHLNRLFFVLLLLIAYPRINAQDLFTSGVIEFQNNNFKAAAEIFEKFIAQNPNEIKAYQYLINSYIKLEEFDKAINVIEENKLKFLNDKDIFVLLGKLYMKNQRFDKAEQTLIGVNKNYPNDPEVKTLLARVYFNKGIKSADKEKYEEAVKLLEKSLSYDKSFPESYAMLGSLYLQTNEVDKADKIFQEGLKKFPDNNILLGNYALLSIKKKNYDKAIKDLEKVWKNNKDNVQVGLQLAKLYRVKFRIDDAFNIYESLLKKYPKEKAIYNEMLEYYTIINDQENRRKVLQRMEKVFPKDKNITLDKIATYVKEGNDSLAIHYYREYINTHSTDFDVYFDLEKLYEKEKNYKEAKEILLLGNTFGLNSEEYYLKLGELNEVEGKIPAAKSIYKEMIQHYPDNFLSYFRIGNIFFNKNNLDSALVYYNLALKVEKDQPFVLAKIAKLYELRRDKENAIDYYKRAFIYNMINLNSEQKMLVQQLKSTNNLLTLMDKVDLSQDERIKIYKSNIEEANKFLAENLSSEKYLDEINKLIEEYPTSAILYYYKGMFYESINDFKVAEELYLRTLSDSPRNVEVHKRIGQLYRKMGKNNKAIQSYKRVLSLDNEDREAYKSLIQIYREEGRLSELCDEWLKFHFTQPGNKVLTEYLIEALHKADRKADAAKVINEDKGNE